MSDFEYMDKTRGAFVHRVLGRGPNGGKRETWEARAGGMHICLTAKKADCKAALATYLATGVKQEIPETWKARGSRETRES